MEIPGPRESKNSGVMQVKVRRPYGEGMGFRAYWRYFTDCLAVPTPAAAYRKYPIYSSKQKLFNASYEEWQKDLPSMRTRLYCSFAPAPFGKNVFGSATINTLSLSEL
jgi:hypothetical protein